MKSAIDAASSGDTLQLIYGIVPTSINDEINISSGKELTIDFNNTFGFLTKNNYITNNGTVHFITTVPEFTYIPVYYMGAVNNGTLEIRNASLHEGVRIVNNGTLDYSTGSSSGLIENNGTLTVTAPLTTLYNNINGALNIYSAPLCFYSVQSQTLTVQLRVSSTLPLWIP